MALTDKQREAIEYIVKGENISNVAKLVKVNRTTIYEWMKKEEFKSEIDRLTTEIKNGVKQKINAKIDSVLDQVYKIATTSKSEKNKLDACTYLLDQALGRATSKVADVTDKETDNAKVDLDNELQGLDNVVDFEKVKAK